MLQFPLQFLEQLVNHSNDFNISKLITLNNVLITENSKSILKTYTFYSNEMDSDTANTIHADSIKIGSQSPKIFYSNFDKKNPILITINIQK